MTTFNGNMYTFANKNMIVNYQNQKVIDQYVTLYNVPKEKANQLFQEMLMFLYTRSISYELTLVPSQEIGQMWRLFIQYTKDYENFCHFHLKKYIHHQFGSKKDYLQYYQLTQEEIKRKFNLNEELWESPLANEVSVALKRDIFHYQVSQPKVHNNNALNRGCVEIIIGIIIFLIIAGLSIIIQQFFT